MTLDRHTASVLGIGISGLLSAMRGKCLGRLAAELGIRDSELIDNGSI